MAKAIKLSFKLAVYIFAIIGFILVSGYFAVKYGLTKVSGEIDQNSSSYSNLASDLNNFTTQDSDIYKKEIAEKKLLCQIGVIADYSPTNAKEILDNYESAYDPVLTTKMIFALDLRLKNEKYNQEKNDCQTKEVYSNISASTLKEKINRSATDTNSFDWVNQEDWSVIKSALSKDKDKIILASKQSDFDPRLLVAACIVEQERLYHTQREVYEKVFKPLQILGNANKMAWGVMSIKEDTAIQIENNLKDTTSPYYLGEKYANLLDFKTQDPAKERLERLTNDHDHFYSYLYGSLYMKELANQWQNSGYDILNRPEILSTLFNLGFEKSKPKANPEVGGSVIEIRETKYTFGSLSYEFYYSGELQDDYPLK